MTRTVKWERQRNVGILILSNPPINCVTQQLLIDFHDTLDEVEQDKEIKVLLITADNSRVFATGYNQENPPEIEEEKQLLSKILKRITLLSIPTISIISGAAIGEGFEIALACDLRICSDTSRVGFYQGRSTTELTAAFLIELTGSSRAKELLWFGQSIGAEEAQKLGLVNRVFLDSYLMNEGLEMANALLQLDKNNKLWNAFKGRALYRD